MCRVQVGLTKKCYKGVCFRISQQSKMEATDVSVFCYKMQNRQTKKGMVQNEGMVLYRTDLKDGYRDEDGVGQNRTAKKHMALKKKYGEQFGSQVSALQVEEGYITRGIRKVKNVTCGRDYGV